ncbi:hypothetical protein N4G70_17165 [Streptomyces sp. ASQP_92]|uniref:hypothetical protein n=1 Tax=Streptomyces sp. ASQP_92 TaxID=2979116 RepID=UPI0021C044AE|nr:hypothetical protein [Streptomyces sp. ASQP_92]MCT9090572.1 hypothetical protein [Streptomyces sp. ASQP_92]
MQLRQPQAAGTGATLPARLALTEAHVDHGFWFTVLRYRSTNDVRPEPVELRMMDNAHAAIRYLRIEVRNSHVLGMTPREVERAVEWTNTGWIHALASLATGTDCGFTVITHSGARVEWSVRPLQYVELTVDGSCVHPPQLSARRPELSS